MSQHLISLSTTISLVSSESEKISQVVVCQKGPDKRISTKTPAEPTAIYYGSFYVGTFAGLMLSRQLLANPVALQILLATATVGMGFGVYVVLYIPYGLPFGIIAHSLGCFGMTAF